MTVLYSLCFSLQFKETLNVFACIHTFSKWHTFNDYVEYLSLFQFKLALQVLKVWISLEWLLPNYSQNIAINVWSVLLSNVCKPVKANMGSCRFVGLRMNVCKSDRVTHKNSAKNTKNWLSSLVWKNFKAWLFFFVCFLC